MYIEYYNKQTAFDNYSPHTFDITLLTQSSLCLQMAKAVATTAAFITMVGSEFVQKYLGEGPRMVRDVFRLARENSPAIVFIDEIGGWVESST